MERLFGFIDDDSRRRELEEEVQNQISRCDQTILTHSYYDEETSDHILQLSTYVEGELFGGEVLVREESDSDIEIFKIELRDTLLAINKASRENYNRKV